MWGPDNSDSTVTKLRAGRPGSDFRQGRISLFCHNVQTESSARPASYPVGTGALPSGYRGWGVKLTTHHLRGATSPLPSAWRGA
jgi:hypothetical protein